MSIVENIGKPSPKWYRKFRKIWINTENAVIAVLLATGHTDSSLLILCLKVGTSWLLDSLDTLLVESEPNN